MQVLSGLVFRIQGDLPGRYPCRKKDSKTRGNYPKSFFRQSKSFVSARFRLKDPVRSPRVV